MTYIHQEPKKSPAELYKRRVEAQRERLFYLLSRDQFDAVADLPYMARLAIEKWHLTEQTRVENWFDESSDSKAYISELTKMLNSQKPERQAVIAWLAANKDKWQSDNLGLIADLLMQVTTDARLAAVSDSAKNNARSRVARNKKKLQEIGLRWLQYEAGLVDGIKHSKNSAAPLIANEFHTSEDRIRKFYLAGIESNPDAFPAGVEAARSTLGISS